MIGQNPLSARLREHACHSVLLISSSSAVGMVSACTDGRTSLAAAAFARIDEQTLPHTDPWSSVRVNATGSAVDLIRMAKLNGVAPPEARLRHVLAHIAEHPGNRVDEFLPWHCTGHVAFA